MDDVFVLIVFGLICLVASRSGKAKKKKRRRQNPPADAAYGAEPFAAKKAQRNPDAAFSRPEPDCAQRPMHLHEVTQQQMSAAAEGEDPCHRGGAGRMRMRTAPDVQDSAPDAQQEDACDTLAQDVLRGIVMSEILTRPCERMARRRR